MHVTIETPGSRVEKWHKNRRNPELSEAEALGFVLAAALYAVGPTRLEEVLGHCIVALADHRAFEQSLALPASDAVVDLCISARRIVSEWQKHDRVANEGRLRR